MTGENYNEVRVKGASPPVDQQVLRKGTKGRTTSTPSVKFDYAYAQRNDTTSSRSTTGLLHGKSKSGTTLGETANAPKSNFKFDGRAQPVRCSTTVLEDFPSPSGRGCSLPSQFDILMSNSGYEFDKVESSATAVKTPVVTKFDQPNCIMAPKSGVITRFETRHSRREFAPRRRRPMSSSAMQPVKSVGMTDKRCGISQHCNCSTKPFGYVNTSARDKVALPRSNLYPNARQIAMNQSGGRIYYQVARASFSQSQPSIHTATDQSEASNPGFLL